MNKTFIVLAINRHGETSHLEIHAPTLSLAKGRVRQLGLITKKIKQKRIPIFLAYRPISKKDIRLFTQQLSLLCHAEIPLMQVLNLLETNQTQYKLKNLILDIKQNIANGFTLAEALRKYPSMFQDFYLNLIELGEMSGTLNTMLKHITTHEKKILAINLQIKKALIYPITVILLACGVLFGLLLFMVPKFQALYSNFGAKLPISTQWIIYLSEGILKHLLLIFIGVLSIPTLYKFGIKQSTKVANFMARLSLKLPLAGGILKSIILARFTNALSIAYTAGLPLYDALIATANICGNKYFAEGIVKISHDIAKGQSIHVAMQVSELFPEFVLMMMHMGEESGQIDIILKKINTYYTEAIDSYILNLNSLLEPVVMIIVGGLIGGLMLTLYLPILKLGSIVC